MSVKSTNLIVKFLLVIIACLLGLLVGNTIGGVMASLFWNTGEGFLYLMASLCFALAGGSLFIFFRILADVVKQSPAVDIINPRAIAFIRSTP